MVKTIVLLSLLFTLGCFRPVSLNGNIYENPTYECPVELLTEIKELLTRQQEAENVRTN